MANDPTFIDSQVGRSISLRRERLGISVEQASKALNISPQELEYYESGASRIQAGRLLEIAKFLEVPPSYFFKEIHDGYDPTAAERDWQEQGVLVDGLQLIRIFVQIKDATERLKIIDFAASVAARQEKR